MSLINQMLRDLEQRQGTPAPRRNPLSGLRSPAPSARQPARFGGRGWLLLPALALAMVLGAVLARSWSGMAPPAAGAAPADGVVAAPAAAERSAHTPPLATATAEAPATIARPTPSTTPPAPVAVVAAPASAPRLGAADDDGTATAATPKAVEANAAPQRSAATPPPAPGNRTPVARRDDATALAAKPEREALPATPAAAPAAADPVTAERPVRTPPAAPEPTAATLLRRGQADLGRGDRGAAEQRFRQALDLSPGQVEARAELAGLLIASGRHGEAQALLEAGLALAPGQPTLARLRARLLLEAGELDAAAELLQATRPGLAEAPDHYALLAATEQRRGRHAVAAQLYRQLLEHRPGEGGWWVAYAISLEGLGHADQAVAAYRTALHDRALAAPLRRYAEARLQATGP